MFKVVVRHCHNGHEQIHKTSKTREPFQGPGSCQKHARAATMLLQTCRESVSCQCLSRCTSFPTQNISSRLMSRITQTSINARGSRLEAQARIKPTGFFFLSSSARIFGKSSSVSSIPTTATNLGQQPHRAASWPFLAASHSPPTPMTNELSRQHKR